MTCCEYETRLSAYMDGELPRWTRWKIQNHVRHCEQCSCSLRELTAVDNCLASLPELEGTPEYLTGSIMHRLPAMPPARPFRPGMMPWAAGLAVAGMQALALFGAYWWGFMRGTTTSGPATIGASMVSPSNLSSSRTPAAGTPVVNSISQPDSASPRGPIWSHMRNGLSGVDALAVERLDDPARRPRRSPVPVGPGGTVVLPVPVGSH